MGWIQAVLAILQLTPQILQLIVQIEGIFGAGNGAVKKQLVMNSVSSAPVDIQTHISSMVDSHVAALNTAGVFKKP